MPLRNYVIGQAQAQSGSLSCWLGGKVRLKYFPYHFWRNTITVVRHLNFDLTIVSCRAHADGWDKTAVCRRYGFGGRGIKSIIDQIKDYPAQVLRNHIYLSNVMIEISFCYCI